MRKIIIGILTLLALVPVLLILLSFLEPNGVTDEEYQQVWTWLTCDECSDDEWEAVRRIGRRAVPLVKNLNGPLSGNRLENMQRRYGATWARIPGPKSDSTAFVDRRIGNLESVIQRRAIIALARLDPGGGLDEVAALAHAGSLPDDVLGEYQRAVMANLPASPDSQEVVVTGPTGTFPTPAVRRCRSAPPAPRPAEPGVCFSYEGLIDYGPTFTVYDHGGVGPGFRMYSRSLPEGIYEVRRTDGQLPPSSYLLWVVPMMVTDTIHF